MTKIHTHILKDMVLTVFLLVGNTLTVYAFSISAKEGLLFFFAGVSLLGGALCIPIVIAILRQTYSRTIRYVLWGVLTGGILGGTGLLAPLFFFFVYRAEGGVGILVGGGLGALCGTLGSLFVQIRNVYIHEFPGK